MRVYFSGGSPIPEDNLQGPDIMLSAYVNVNQKTRRPDSRLRTALKIRRRYNKKRSKR